jgi:hypothetical protein
VTWGGSAASPLRGLRLAVTIPPRAWFGGVDYFFALDMAEELRRMGAATLPVDLAVICSGDSESTHGIIAAVRAFRPDVAIGLPNAGYIMACKTPTGENIFRDVLQIPSIMIWDHGVLQFAPQVLGALPSDAAASQDGCLKSLRAALDHSLYVHYSPDRGHIAAIDSLRILDGRKVRSFIQPAWPAYVRHDKESVQRSTHGSRLAFAGNVYVDASRQAPFRPNAFLEGIENRVLRAKEANFTAPLWDLLRTELNALDPIDRASARLGPDESFYWTFQTVEIETVGTTHARLHALTALRTEVDYYGNFCEPQVASTLESQYGLRFRGCLNCVTDLPSLYRNSELMIDVVHPGYISGTSPKIAACFAAGGTILFDYKNDFRDALGDVADAVMYRTVDQMNGLVETYLSQPSKKLAISRELQQRILREFTFTALWERVLAREPIWRSRLVSQSVTTA